MDREKLLRLLEQRYTPRRDILSRVPLGMQADALWEELLNRRRSGAAVLPLYNPRGMPYWYATTEKMVAASEKIVEALLENDTEFDPYTDAPSVSTLEEVFYTGYVEGAQISMQEAMSFITEEREPHGIEEQLIANNRMAASYAGANLYRPVDETLLKELISILTERMDRGGPDYRADDEADSVTLFGEQYLFPAARNVPDRIRDLCAFLASPQVHPLIKAGAAQVYLMAVRPFAEGNERLGRLLSCMILLRAGYTFFGDVSLSALIARKSYGYYEAIANCLREENEGDLTYFLEYFLEMLSRAVDERRLRQEQDIKESLQRERTMAQTPLAGKPPSDPSPPDDGPGESADLQDKGYKISDGTFSLDEFQTVPVAERETGKPSGLTPLEQLVREARDAPMMHGRVAGCLLQRRSAGHTPFYAGEIASELSIDNRNTSKLLRKYERKGILQYDHLEGVRRYYRFAPDQENTAEAFAAHEPATEIVALQEYSSAVLDLLDTLDNSNSPKDNRLGYMIKGCLGSGEINYSDYESRGEGSKWPTDMAFAAQLGLVKRESAKHYTILKDLNTEPSMLTKGQKKMLTQIYGSFGGEDFSTEMVFATLDYSGSQISAYLHQFTLLKILDCRKEDVFRYRFLVNPEDHPDYFIDAA